MGGEYRMKEDKKRQITMVLIIKNILCSEDSEGCFKGHSGLFKLNSKT